MKVPSFLTLKNLELFNDKVLVAKRVHCKWHFRDDGL